MDGPTSHRGLTYPRGRHVPAPGALVEIAPGIGWARLPVPGSLDHVNIWALDEGGGHAIVDTGLDTADCRAAWQTLLAGPLAGRAPTRLICTHFHPDHVGLVGWIAARFGVDLWMSRTEWLMARMLTLDARESPPDEAVGFWRAAGWSDDQVAAGLATGWGRFSAIVSPVPARYVRLQDGDRVTIGTRHWQVLIGRGHSPEHACLWDEDNAVLIAGDQVLPRISSNVSLSLHEPRGDPLGDWLASIDRLSALPADTLVLPSHGEPFTGLHARLAALRDGHLAQLDALAAFLREPRRAVDCFGLLFRRPIGADTLGLATGEAMANLRRLELEGRAVAERRGGVLYFSAVR